MKYQFYIVKLSNIFFVFLICLLMAPRFVAADSTTEKLENFGDIMQFAIPLAGLAGTYIADDPEGRIQLGKSYVTANGITTALKGVYGKVRPKSKSRTSFPSGHTTSAFAGAAFIDQRYGHGWGSISYTAAAITAYSRIRSENHFVDDTIAGASIAIMSNLFWVTPYESNVTVMPALMGDGVGFAFSVNDANFDKKYKIENNELKPKLRFELAMGGATLEKNIIAAPASTGTAFNLDNFEKRDDPTTSASVLLDWYIDQRHTLSFSLAPFESRDNGQFSQPVNFGGNTFPAGTNISSAWRHYDLRATYAYDLIPKSDWNLNIGAAISYQFTEIDLSTEDNSVASRIDDSVILPLLHTSLGYDITSKLKISAELNGVSVSDDKLLDGNLSISYRLNHYWDTGVGIGFYQRDINTSELKNELKYNTAFITIGYHYF